MSHPVWVRGLKLDYTRYLPQTQNVAPRVGAWIETFFIISESYLTSVAPRVGAWIETVTTVQTKSSCGVAPRVGAWIETSRSRRIEET